MANIKIKHSKIEEEEEELRWYIHIRSHDGIFNIRQNQCIQDTFVSKFNPFRQDAHTNLLEIDLFLNRLDP